MKRKKTKTKKSLLSGFGASSLITEKIDEDVSSEHTLTSFDLLQNKIIIIWIDAIIVLPD